MSGGGHSSTVYNWQLENANKDGREDKARYEPRVETVVCDYCGNKSHVFAHSIMQKCPSCGARK